MIKERTVKNAIKSAKDNEFSCLVHTRCENMFSSGYDHSLLSLSFPRFSNVSMLSVVKLSPSPR
jgi:hypothetical protein